MNASISEVPGQLVVSAFSHRQQNDPPCEVPRTPDFIEVTKPAVLSTASRRSLSQNKWSATRLSQRGILAGKKTNYFHITKLTSAELLMWTHSSSYLNLLAEYSGILNFSWFCPVEFGRELVHVLRMDCNSTQPDGYQSWLSCSKTQRINKSCKK